MNTVYNNEIFMMRRTYDDYIFIKFNGMAFTQVLSEKIDDVNYLYKKMMSYDNNVYVTRAIPYDNAYLYKTTDFKTFTSVDTGGPLCVYNNDLYIITVDNDTNIYILQHYHCILILESVNHNHYLLNFQKILLMG